MRLGEVGRLCKRQGEQDQTAGTATTAPRFSSAWWLARHLHTTVTPRHDVCTPRVVTYHCLNGAATELHQTCKRVCPAPRSCQHPDALGRNVAPRYTRWLLWLTL